MMRLLEIVVDFAAVALPILLVVGFYQILAWLS